jgi:hypothetical protein
MKVINHGLWHCCVCVSNNCMFDDYSSLNTNDLLFSFTLSTRFARHLFLKITVLCSISDVSLCVVMVY